MSNVSGSNHDSSSWILYIALFPTLLISENQWLKIHTQRHKTNLLHRVKGSCANLDFKVKGEIDLR